MTAAEQIDINVSFLMVSGIRLVLDDLIAAAARGVSIRILCGNYANITQPEALYLLKKGALGERLELRFYNVANHSFHAKAYFSALSGLRKKSLSVPPTCPARP